MVIFHLAIGKFNWRMNISNTSQPFPTTNPSRVGRTKDTSTSNRLSTRPIRPRETVLEILAIRLLVKSPSYIVSTISLGKSKAFSARIVSTSSEQGLCFFLRMGFRMIDMDAYLKKYIQNTCIHIYLDLPKGAEWMIKGSHTPSLRVRTGPFGRCWYIYMGMALKTVWIVPR